MIRAVLSLTVCLLLIAPALAQDLTVCSYNVESGGADPDTVATRIAEHPDVDILGLLRSE